ncbi:uncharacterized protein B0I36DRAFT_282150 [Microdochium trichocladiopsis]|uniref:RING-type domain-containing protein n=1 Tax=Microdochium trichocladiopsis TaxID=1682393 RepID=A0A9P8YIU7_9PEZI|nr:uncharacterized protein B0I36DRAFT_282150 [Microdochium trichocladiopsis]KAH7041301.1 hypothetical protein B0I36DRAFT_282150 [Microdochium trichocladiopsis]
MSHSKRNTSRAVFTSHERDLAKKAWGANSARLTRESFLDFSACRLCLETARDPVSCTHGDIFCRECALSNILAQKKEIKRLAKVREAEAREAEEQKDRQDAEDRERAIREFEMTQNGLDVRLNLEWRGTPLGKAEEEEEIVALVKEADGSSSTPTSEAQRPGKRKFELDEQELLRIAQEDRTKARKAIEDEKSAKAVLPSFWTPSITPSSNTKDTLHNVTKKTKTVPMCPASAEDDQHPYSLHSLVTLDFSEEMDDRTKKPVRSCPACKKALTNASKPVLAKPCGHVLCRNCVEQFVKPSKHNNHHHHDPHGSEDAAGAAPLLLCYVCDADLTDRDDDDMMAKHNGNDKKDRSKKKDKSDKDKIRPGLVDLRCEGTGFSAGGANQVKKSGVAFQC